MIKSRLGKWSLQGGKWRFILFICCMVTLFVCSSVAAFKLPDTGQTKCYQGVSPYAEILCAGTGQDGAYTINPMSFTDNVNGTVTDNNTGLMWQQQDDGTFYDWYKASGTYDATYNPSSQSVCGSLTLGGHSDWRLPAKKELITIVDYGVPYPGPTINTNYFPNTKSSYYWSSTTFVFYLASAWFVYFYDGSVGDYYMGRNCYVRCVRGGQPQQSFTDNRNGTVTDNRTGLIWQQDPMGFMTWDSALSYCEGLSLGGHSDWRLPNIKELESIEDDTRWDPAIDTRYFHAGGINYRSSTTYAYNPSYAWSQTLHYGGYYYKFKSNSECFRCVRGSFGPSQLRAKATSSTKIVLVWIDNSVNETGFKIERKLGSCSPTGWTQIAVKGANAATYTSTGLTPDTTYSYRVRAYNAGGNTAYSNCASAKTGVESSPNAPSSLRATSVSTSKINICWNDNSTDEKGFKIYRKVDNGSWKFLYLTDAGVKCYSDTNAEGNTGNTATPHSYSYYVKACKDTFCSPNTNTATVPYKPTSLTATPYSSSQINLTWTDTSNNEIGFQIYRKSGACSSTNPWGLLTTTNINSYLNTGLSSGTTYSYKTRAYTRSSAMPYAYGYSLFSNCDDATTP